MSFAIERRHELAEVDDPDGVRRRNLIMATRQIAPTKPADSSERICVQQSSSVGEASCGSSSGLGAWKNSTRAGSSASNRSRAVLDFSRAGFDFVIRSDLRERGSAL